mgnify:CR=1 FL=1
MAQTKVKDGLIDGTFGTEWVSTIQTSNFTAVAGEGYFVNTTSAAITVTLPGSPTAGDEVSIVDYAGTADTNNITITSSDNINGSSNDVKIDYERGGVSMVYVDATQGWIAYNANNETAQALVSDLPLTVDYLVVAGGAGGGSGYRSGGGGAGGLRTSYATQGGAQTEASVLNLDINTDYTVSVGPGGGVNSEANGSNGTNSTFSNITAVGGGGGGAPYTPDSDGSNSTGGSGGGGGGYTGDAGEGGTSGTYGYDGGNGDGLGYQCGGGGGGAGAVGNNGGNGSNDGDGGIGVVVNILNSANAATESVGEVSGSDVYYAGGGGGGNYGGGNVTIGGLGGGSAGGSYISTYTDTSNASPNTGGGGGGSSASSGEGSAGVGGSGGSGVVILRYPNTYTISETTSPTVLSFNTYTEGSDKVTVFTSGENGTIQFS